MCLSLPTFNYWRDRAGRRASTAARCRRQGTGGDSTTPSGGAGVYGVRTGPTGKVLCASCAERQFDVGTKWRKGRRADGNGGRTLRGLGAGSARRALPWGAASTRLAGGEGSTGAVGGLILLSFSWRIVRAWYAEHRGHSSSES